MKIIRPQFTVALLCIVSQALSAQTFPAHDPILKRIWSIGMDSSRLPSLANQLLDSIGPRLTGSPGQRMGNNWLVAMYKSWGIEAKNEQYGTWRGWRRGIATVALLSPRVRVLEAALLGWSPGTNSKDIDGGTIILPRFRDSTEFVRWLPQVQGKYVLISRAMSSCRPNADWDEAPTPAVRAGRDSSWSAENRAWQEGIRGTGYAASSPGLMELSRRLEAAHAAGIFSSWPKDAPGSFVIDATANEVSPSIALGCEDYGLVYRLTANNQHPRIRVNADAELLGEVPVFNTIARIPGREKPNEYVMLSAHFDSYDGGSGAIDNGTGTLMMMEAMRILKAVYPNPKRTILVGHWSGEEQGLVGSRAWSEDHPDVVAGMQALFNQDDGTGRTDRVNGGGASGPSINGGLLGIQDHLEAWRAKLPKEFTDSIHFAATSDPPVRPNMDGAVFSCKGAPTFGFWGKGWNYGQAAHSNRDTYDKVVFDDLKGNAVLVAMLAYLASEDPTPVSREKSPGPWPACGTASRKTIPNR